MERELERIGEKSTDGIQYVRQVALIFAQNHKIVHVAQIVFYPQFFFDKVIKLVKVDIGKQLARQVADGDTREKACNDAIENLQKLWIGNGLTDNLAQDGVVNRSEKL